MKTLILLHGRGSTAEDILGLAPEFADEKTRIIAPQAKNHQWYPHSLMAENNEPDLKRSLEMIHGLIKSEKDQVYLLGFSQGACLALEYGARFGMKYGGIIAFSGALIGTSVDEKKYRGDFQGTKIFIGISENDPHIPLSRVKETKDLLMKMNAEVMLKVYPGSMHSVRPDEIKSAKKFIFINLQ